LLPAGKFWVEVCKPTMHHHSRHESGWILLQVLKRKSSPTSWLTKRNARNVTLESIPKVNFHCS
jgi:hypothetical protein